MKWLKADVQSGAFKHGKRFVWAAVVLCVAVAVIAIVRHEQEAVYRGPTLRIGYENSPPHQVVKPDGGPGGISIEILSEACRRRHIPIEWVHCSGGPEPNFASGKVDLWPLVGDLPGRRKLFYISEPWLSNYCWMVTRENSGIATTKDTVGRTVWVPNDRPGRVYSAESFPGANIVGQPDYQSILQGVISGQADAGLVWGNQAVVARLRLLDVLKGNSLHFFAIPRGRIMFGVAASRSKPEAIQAADLIVDEIGKMSEDGTISSLHFCIFLDPVNEVDTLHYERNVQRRDRYMSIAIGVLILAIASLGFQTRRLKRARRAADAASRAKSEFLANMSHEIRTPLNGVIGMTELTMSTSLTPQQHEYLGAAHQSAEALLALVNDILDFSKIEAGMMQLELLSVDLRELVESAAKTFALRAHQKNLELTVEIAPDCPDFIQADLTRLRQVLLNLLGNAFKFTASGEVRVEVKVEKEVSGRSFLKFAVIDTGIGIPKGKEAALFETFSQADASTTRHYGGTGLGLAICRRIVTLMGGRIWHETGGIGATFCVVIPLLPAPEPASMQAEEPVLAGKHVLIVDDHTNARRIIQDLLMREKARVQSATSGAEALAAVTEAQSAEDGFALILLDSRMPGEDSVESARALLRQAGKNGGRLLLMLTADDSQTLSRCQNLGSEVAHITKPISRRELIAAAKLALAQSLPAKAAASEPTRNSNGLRAMAVDDNPVNLKVVQTLLEQLGYKVSAAQNGREAVELFGQQEFDLILMDVQMPDMDGIEATVAIRQAEAMRHRRTLIVAVTASAMREDQEHCLAAGMDGYLTKPINGRQFAEYIKALQNRMLAKA